MAQPEIKTLLDSSARTASTQTNTIVNQGWQHAIFVLDVTAVPGGGTQTLTPQLEIYIPTSATWEPITAFAATAADFSGEKVYVVGPGVLETSAISDQEVAGIPLPVKSRVNITHSSTGSWTYSLVAHLI